MSDEPATGDVITIEYHGVDTTLYLPNRDDLIQARIRAERSFYEMELLRDISIRVSPGSLVVDAGANIGNHTVFFAQHLGLKVAAFEPHPELFDILCKNVRLNDLDSVVETFNIGLGATAHTRSVSVVDTHNMGKTMLRRDGDDSLSAEVRSLDEIDLSDRVSLLKVDVEGMELEVLRGAERILSEDRPLLYVEAQAPSYLSEVEHLLLRHGYIVVDRFNSTPTYLFAPVEDDRTKLLTLSKRMTELYRDMRTLGDRVATVPSSVADVRAVQTAQGERTNALLARAEETRTAIATMLERTAPLADGDWTKKLEDRLREALASELSRVMGAEKESVELRRLRFINQRYQRKIETLLGSVTWRSTTPLRRLGSAFSNKGKPDQPMSADGFFAKVERQARAAVGGGTRSPARTRSAPHSALSSQVELPEPLPASKATVDASEARARVRAAIAAIPEREAALEQTVASLLPQVDELCVYLNGFDEVPEFLKQPGIEVARSQDHGDRGDAGKFFWVDDYEGFYLTCDDDIIYCSDYVERSLKKLRSYSLHCIIGWHGSLIKEPFEDYYTNSSRRVFSFEYDRPVDTPVHILGTGCVAFHTDTIRVRHADFEEPNMADVYFARLAQKQRVSLIVVEHEKGDLVAIPEAQESSINLDSREGSDTKKNTREKQNRLVSEMYPWRVFEFLPLNVLLIGRFESYRKGGIFKSCHLIAENLRKRGHHVEVLDTQNDLGAVDAATDIAWIYPGDPDRPDYATVDSKIKKLQAAGVPVLVNFSYLGTATRSRWIAEQLDRYNAPGAGSQVFAAVFTESVQDDPHLREYVDHLLMVPKTITLDDRASFSFEEREGICFGDATKLGNDAIIGGASDPWIQACRQRLPHVKLYAYKQYSGREPNPHLTMVPHMADGFGPWLAGRKLFVCLNQHLTFEMVACEAQQVGVPILYRHMRHSLSEYIGPTGLRVRSPEELGELCAWLYNDQHAWAQFSNASSLNAAGLDVSLHGANLEASLRTALGRARKLGRQRG